ncbi:unnamed protein product [Parnassius mnemosyne]|uniref:Uncharacterized protein n=1 Tax=Parnassius mnemosyne TaxID=213953 RepID=A0AAV1LZP4_9NEOP
MNITKVTNIITRKCKKYFSLIKVAYETLCFRLAPTITEGPVFGRRKEKLLRLILEKRNQVLQSNLGQKMSVAKRYYTLEMSPPSINESQKLQEDVELVKDFIKSGCYKYLTVKQAWLLLLMCTEVGLWFFMGETIGKMHIVGYKV